MVVAPNGMASRAAQTRRWKSVPRVVHSTSKPVPRPAKYACSWEAITVNASGACRQSSWTTAPPFWPGVETVASAVPPVAVADSSPVSSRSPSGLGIVA